MTHTNTFDTLKFANRLKEAGVPTKQAECQAELMAETINSELATKKDLRETKKDIIIWLGGIVIIASGIIIAIVGHLISLLKLAH
jgi:hypothetical protein